MWIVPLLLEISQVLQVHIILSARYIHHKHLHSLRESGGSSSLKEFRIALAKMLINDYSSYCRPG